MDQGQQPQQDPANSQGQSQGQSQSQSQGDGQQHAQQQQGSSQPTPPQDNTPFVTKIVLPDHNLDLDDNYFLKLLAGSLSLSLAEKKKIIESISTLSQYQVDKLIEIFEEERVKFAELETRMKEQVQKLREKQYSDWQMLEMDVDKQAKKNADEQKADEIRKKLGL